MTSFVSTFCDTLLNEFLPEELHTVAIVVPSQRIALHIKKELSTRLLQPVFLPDIKTINVFIGAYFKQKPIDKLSALFELYQSYCKVFKNPDSFDSFLSWGYQILSDFNDIDKYLLDEKNVFGNLKSIKEIETWSFNSETLSETQKKFLLFWEQLGELYTVYNQDLKTKGLCTVSKMYKEIANDPYLYFKDIKHSKIYFLAFNALSKSEEQLFRYFTKSGLGVCIWDADEYYFANKEQEAGMFIRNYAKWSSISESKFSNELVVGQKKIQLLGAKSNLDQVNYITKILAENSSFNKQNSAVVFADESLLRPFLNVIPQNIEQMNVAMGYPLNQSYAFTLLEILFKTLKSINRYKNKKYLYHKDFELIFKNELIQNYLAFKKCDTVGLIAIIQKYNYTYIPYDLLALHLGDSMLKFDFLFYKENQNINQVLEAIIILFQDIRTLYLKQNSEVIECEALYKLIIDLYKIAEYLSAYPYVQTVEGLRNITASILHSETISFFGEPLLGLQVLGLLETRGLDFENVILVSCNEDILPKSTFSDSLMPNDLRTYFQLPTKLEKDAIFAYYFYRLLQRAKNIFLIYNDGLSEKLSSNEKSRFLLQITKELQLTNNAVKLTEITYDFERNIKLSEEKAIPKDAAYTDRVDKYLKSGISVSAVNKYLDCPKDFYVRYILRINEEKDIEETIENSTYGTIIHEVLENLYKEFSPTITTESIDQMLKIFQSKLESTFLKYFPGENFREGKNHLQYKLAEHTLESYLKAEKKVIQQNGVITIIGLEQNYGFTLFLDTSKGKKEVTFKGNFDRIDKIGNTTRIIDYKTGLVDAKDLDLSIDNIAQNPKALQLMFYYLLYYNDAKNAENKVAPNDLVTCGMVSLKKISQGLIPLTLDKDIIVTKNDEALATLEDFLIDWIEELYDVNVPIIHNSNAKYCDFCM